MAHLGAEYKRISEDKTMGGLEKSTKILGLMNQAKESEAIKEATHGNVGKEDLQRWGDTTAAAAYMNQRDAALQLGSKWSKQAIDERAAMTKSGQLVRGKDGELVLSAGAKKGLSADGSQASQLALEITKDQTNLVNITDEDKRLEAMTGIQAKQDNLAGRIGNMSTPDKRKFAKAMAGSQAADLAMDIAGADSQVKGLMKATGGKATAAAARMLGLHMGKDAEGKLTAEDLQKQLGMSGNEEFGKTLSSALDALKGGKNNAGQLMQQALAGLSDEARQKIKATNEGENDPLQKKMADNSDKSTTALVEIAKKIGVSNEALQKLASADSNPDKP
jgi:hypothetical protein